MYLDHGASSDGYNASEVGFTWKTTVLKFFLSNSLMEDSAHSLYSISFIPGRTSILTTVDIQAARISCFGESSLTDDTDRKSTRLNSSHVANSYAVLCQ